MDEALVYIVCACGIQCGTGRYMLLQKNNEGWQVVKVHTVAVS